MKALALKYRPKVFEDVVEQGSTIKILQKQLLTDSTMNCYLFVGPAGCGKTTCARIMAREINKGHGTPIEIDAASNNGVENVRDIINGAQMKSLDSEYKVYILDECHMLSTGAWNAMLKLIEEPPMKTIFIFCTTDPQKIPATIISRVQRFDFQRIGFDGIVARLEHIIKNEINDWVNEQCKEYGITFDQPILEDNVVDNCPINYELEALKYIAKLADGGMRDAITMLDKCLSFSSDLTLDNVIKALGAVNYDDMFDLTDYITDFKEKEMLELIESKYHQGCDLKQFIKQYSLFILDMCKYITFNNFNYIQIPNIYEERLKNYISSVEPKFVKQLLDKIIEISNLIKWEHNCKAIIQMNLILLCSE